MSYADIKIGYNCNNNCIHCVIAQQREVAKKLRGNENRSTEEYKQEILKSKANGFNEIVITGGEPTIRPDLVEIAKFAHFQGIRVNLQTNGRLFSYYNFAKKIAPYINSFTIAVHGHTPELHDSIIRSKGGFEQTIAGIKNLVSLNKLIAGKVVITTYNYKHLKDILVLFCDLGINIANFAFPHPNGNAEKYFDAVVPYYKDIQPFVEDCIEYAKSVNFNLEFEAILPCALEGQYEIKFFSDLKNLTNGYSAELKQLDTPYARDWNTVRRAIKRMDEKCSRCIYGSICEGYWQEYVEKRGFSEFNPVEKNDEK